MSLNITLKYNRPGDYWFCQFVKRHKLSVKKPEELERSRREETSDPFIIHAFYDLCRSEMEHMGISDCPECIITTWMKQDFPQILRNLRP
jgi:hypothetical protein